MVAARCVPLGIGSDIGGSIRIPAAFCGIRGFKPTPHRVSLEGNRNGMPNNFSSFTTIRCCDGPLGKSVEDLKLALEV